ncbi:flagellar biosynthesis protein FlhF [Paenibacillus sp. oral taxon 786 str. D14]|uniref:flagellar biosynthesis protein FlhF n=1 Tax=Paenibacillus sp. oral taxon 786 TaxID=652715 RepID=UPI0001AFCD3C|nr:flagellar biosynthesis protein FlhF [Paenibacillus sp. oral taxon 786]EES75072.1 flagellar biosynthesis protein FlhF [Paenibacillus sp. oral taxon 786 str. D14]
MRVKRYIVDTMPDAMLKIRNELGSDAVILSTKEVKLGGFLGMFQKKKIEVIAATEEKAAPAPKAKPLLPAQPSVPAPVARQAVPEAYRKTSQLAQPAASPQAGSASPVLTAIGVQEREEPIITPVMPPAPQPPVTEPQLRQTSIEPASSAASARLEAAIARAADPEQFLAPTGARSVNSAKEERLLEEIRQMKMWLSELAKKQTNGREMPPGLHSIQQQLMSQEVGPELADRWVEEVYEAWLSSGKTLSDDDMQARLRTIVNSFLDHRIDAGIGDQTRIVYIAGPTGVGKTTTIAKLAADQIFRLHKKVGFITADTYRISAIEQLRTYATILNVPLEVVQSPGDVQRAMQRLEHCDLILMDTAGRNYLNELFVAELHSLLAPSDVSETYLVLSLTSKAQDMKRITEHFSKYNLDKLIFTKLDETETTGAIFNLLNEYPFKVSFLTNGQNVPDDLLQADAELMVDMLLGERKP